MWHYLKITGLFSYLQGYGGRQMDNINEFKIATPAELREANGRSRDQLLEDALVLIKESFDENANSLDWFDDGSGRVSLFPDIPNTLNTRKQSFIGIISDPMFPTKEFNRKLADFHWKLELFIDEFRLVEI